MFAGTFQESSDLLSPLQKPMRSDPANPAKKRSEFGRKQKKAGKMAMVLGFSRRRMPGVMAGFKIA
jgi:hypothetical protein